MHVAFGVDPAYVAPLGVAVASIARVTAGEINIHVVHDAVPPARREMVERCAPAARFNWVELHDAALLSLHGRAHLSRAAYFRLGLPRLLPAAVGRLIYLDCDILVLRSLVDFWTTPLGPHALGAVRSPLVDPRQFATKWALPPPELGYFNSGVLLLDLARLREGDQFDQAIDLAASHRAKVEFADQDVLNVTFWNDWHRLSPRWNHLRSMLQRPDLFPRRPAIVHFSQATKPWLPGETHPFAYPYLDVARQTPFAAEIFQSAALSPAGLAAHRARWMAWAASPPPDSEGRT